MKSFQPTEKKKYLQYSDSREFAEYKNNQILKHITIIYSLNGHNQSGIEFINILRQPVKVMNIQRDIKWSESIFSW